MVRNDVENNRMYSRTHFLATLFNFFTGENHYYGGNRHDSWVHSSKTGRRRMGQTRVHPGTVGVSGQYENILKCAEYAVFDEGIFAEIF